MDAAPQPPTWEALGEAGTIGLTPDGAGLLGGDTSKKTLTRWDVRTGKEEWSVKVSEGWRHTFAFSPDGKLVFISAGSHRALSSENVQLRLWDAATGKLVRTLSGEPKK